MSSTPQRRWSSLPVLLASALAALAVPPVSAAPPQRLPGLKDEVRIVRDREGIPHIYATNDLDAAFGLGWAHAQDRFFQMDYFRRVFSGRVAELLGPNALESDVQLRTLGLRRAAEESVATAPPESLSWFQAYADGVNAWLARNPLPPEYALLELTRARVPAWVPADSAVIGKAIAFQLSFDLEDIDRTIALTAYQTVGELAGFEGATLFSEDVFRSAPLDPTISIPGFLPGTTVPPRAGNLPSLRPKALELARRFRQRAGSVPALQTAFRRSEAPVGSNWWMISGRLSETGAPLLANDPHLGLDLPPIFYEAHLLAFSGNRQRPMVVNGVSFAGAPAIAQGCNLHICWGSTTNPMDVTDVYVEELVLDPASGLPTHTRFRGQLEPIVIIPQTFLANQIGDGALNNLVDAGVSPLDGGLTLIVPRRNRGPIVAVDASDPAAVIGLSVQYAGSRATRELDTFRLWQRAANLQDFRSALRFFDVGSQNWAYTDRAGNIAYFTSGELPLREDLQTLSRPDGTPPYLLRDGTGQLRNEWLPVQNPQPGQALAYEVLPFAEMPQVVNPPAGYILNANNDPVGTTLDNNPLNQLRPGGGLYYLSPGYSDLRAGRIRRLIEEALGEEGDEKISVDELKAMQANNQLLDAEILVPHVLSAWTRIALTGASIRWTDLVSDPRMTAAVSRLRTWDFSTPTGIQEGYDPGDDPQNLPEPSAAEVDASVAATIYSVWRGQMIRRVVDDTLEGIGLGDFLPGGTQAFRAMARQIVEFDTLHGLGSSGVPFFHVDAALSPEEARDVTILLALRDALDLLASDEFAPAFGNSTDLEDYRWGKLHRIVFNHPLGGPFDAPPAGGFEHLAPGLPGVARSGGFETVDAASHNPRAATLNGFMFGSGPARRFVGTTKRSGIEADQIIPGGESGVLGRRHYVSQLGRWLTNHYHPMLLSPRDVDANSASEQILRPVR
jgi:penicillin G amidase